MKCGECQERNWCPRVSDDPNEECRFGILSDEEMEQAKEQILNYKFDGADWSGFRMIAAKDFACAMLSNPSKTMDKNAIIKSAVWFADELIRQLTDEKR